MLPFALRKHRYFRGAKGDCETRRPEFPVPGNAVSAVESEALAGQAGGVMNSTSISFVERLTGQADSKCWSEMFALDAPLVRRWMTRYDVPTDDVDDLVQDVMVIVVREVPGFVHNRRRGAFRNWLKQILVNRLRKY